MKLSLGSTSTRTFMVIPAAVLLEQAHRRRPLRPRWLPVMAWGFLQYCYVGRYRNRYGGGGPGLSRPPERLLSSGPYAVTRNPMYLGHLIFLAGLALFTRSSVATLVAMAHVPWFERRVRGDEENLERLFGDEYREYRDRVARWLPWLS